MKITEIKLGIIVYQFTLGLLYYHSISTMLCPPLFLVYDCMLTSQGHMTEVCNIFQRRARLRLSRDSLQQVQISILAITIIVGDVTLSGSCFIRLATKGYIQ